ncbi:hypothetical protein DSLASN_18150 [Desulfoluna limicola]|uniref:Uncharacterized protein n=1 Tax=Desulfoluna limicola TaxID=2810562 RepID=A0ABM7PG59_9BACT|nr:hypothetical protein DSLASN_18150 [Desulfoluna limicola]
MKVTVNCQGVVIFIRHLQALGISKAYPIKVRLLDKLPAAQNHQFVGGPPAKIDGNALAAIHLPITIGIEIRYIDTEHIVATPPLEGICAAPAHQSRGAVKLRGIDGLRTATACQVCPLDSIQQRIAAF